LRQSCIRGLIPRQLTLSGFSAHLPVQGGIMGEELRGIAVVDVGKTNSKIVLFDSSGKVLAERKTASRPVAAPLYPHLDPKPLIAFCAKHLTDLDGIMPIDVVVPSAHGGAIACLDAQGHLALPVMDYVAEPPPEIF